MALTKFEKLRQQAQEEMEKKLAKIEEEEQKEREKRIAPLVSKYTNLMEEVATKVVTAKVEELEGVKFRKTDVRKRLEDAMEQELEILLKESQEETEKNSIEGLDPAKVKPVEAQKKSGEQPAPEDQN